MTGLLIGCVNNFSQVCECGSWQNHGFFESFLSYVEIRKEIIYNLFDTDFH
jgi:hypothetical protein